MSEVSVELSRLLITGSITQDTPLCVLLEIADAHGINYSVDDLNDKHFSHHLLSTINQTKIKNIIYPISNIKHWKYLARFINKYIPWSRNKLVVAYEYLTNISSEILNLDKIPLEFNHGLQTVENPYSLNACVLYRICRNYNINLCYQTTINHMTYAIKLLRTDTNILISKSRHFIEKEAKHSDLVNMLLNLPKQNIPEKQIIKDYSEQPSPVTNYNILTGLHKQLTNVKMLQERVVPSTVDGSVALAAINFGIDISKSKYPLEEYEILKSKHRFDYKPSDKWLNYWYGENPDIFNLNTTFNPLFPIGYYDKKHLIDLAKREGYTDKEINSNNPYELLQLAYTSETFYQGVTPNLKEKETIINLDKLDEIPYGQLLSYGQRDILLRPITMEELIEMFNANQNFTSPFGAEKIFSATAINKLKYILQCPHGPNPSIRITPETLKIRNDLLEIINCIQLKYDDKSSYELISTYKNADSKTKNAIKKTFDILLLLSMQMRGMLNEKDKYPIEIAIVLEENKGQVALNVTKSIESFQNSCKSLGKIGTIINNLPLVKYKDGVYQPSISKDEGLTIGERIDIVKEGENSKNIKSCIRMSSNWLASSAHKYIKVLGFPNPFDIFKLSHIM